MREAHPEVLDLEVVVHSDPVPPKEATCECSASDPLLHEKLNGLASVAARKLGTPIFFYFRPSAS